MILNDEINKQCLSFFVFFIIHSFCFIVFNENGFVSYQNRLFFFLNLIRLIHYYYDSTTSGSVVNNNHCISL
jgi:hypothetical protein